MVVIEKIWVDTKRAMAYDIDSDEIIDINMTDKEDDPRLLYINDYALVGDKGEMKKLLKRLRHSGDKGMPTPDGYRTPRQPFKWPFWYEFTLSSINPKYGTFTYLIDIDRVVDVEVIDRNKFKEITPHVWTKHSFIKGLVDSDRLTPIPSHIWSKLRQWTLGDSTPIVPGLIEVDPSEEPYSPDSKQFIKNGKVGLTLITPLSPENKIKIDLIKRDPDALLAVVKTKGSRPLIFGASPNDEVLYSSILRTGQYRNEKNGNTTYYIPWSLLK